MANHKLSKKTFWSIMFAIFFGNFLAVLSTTTINVALPVLMQDFQVDLTTIQWVLTGFMLATGTVAPAVGYFCNRYSAKKMYLFALVGFIGTSVLCAVSWNVTSLIAFRVLQGVFTGIIMPTTMTIVYQVVPREQQAFGISIWSLSAMLAPAVGPTLAGWVTYVGDWHWLFWMNVPVGIISLIAVWIFIPSYQVGGDQQLDKLGFSMVILGSLSLLLAFGNGQQWGWVSVKTLGLMAAGILTIALFVRRSLRLKHPLLEFRVFQSWRFSCSMLLVSIITISLYAGGLLTPLFLQTVQGESALTAGLVMLPASLLMAIVVPFTGKWYARFGPVKLVIVGLILMGIGTYELSLLEVDSTHFTVTLWMAVRNLGIAFANMPALNAGMSAIPKIWSGFASSINSWLRQGLASLTIGLFSSLMAARTVYHLGEMQPTGGEPATDTMVALATTMSINDVNFISFIMTLIGIPVTLLLLKKSEPLKVPEQEKVS